MERDELYRRDTEEQWSLRKPVRRVPREVLVGLVAVREAGWTNMLDRRTVQLLAVLNGYPETAQWIEDNPALYARGISHGFEAEQGTLGPYTLDTRDNYR
jgi:hypothetical protein